MRSLISALALISLATIVPAFADTIITSSASFNAQVPGATVEDYGTLSAGTVINAGSTVDGITYDSFTAGPAGDLLGGIITSEFNSVSGVSLGGNQSTSAQFFFGEDSFTITLPNPVNALGVVFNVNLNSGDYGFTEGSTTVETGSAAYDTNTFVFAGIISSTPFQTVTIFSDNADLGSYNVAELEYASVPEPGFFPCVAGCLALIVIPAWKRRVQR